MSLTKVRYAALTDVGVKRSHNQDACRPVPAPDEAHWRQYGHVFVVADGMGGHAVGEKASAKAVQDIPLSYQKYVGPDGVAPAIRRAFTEANADIYDIGQKNPEFKGLGTTATSLVLRPEGAWIGHVGDSRAYRVRGGKVEQLTFDHSWVWEVARRQGIDPDELGDFKKNVIIRSLGPDSDVEVDVEGPHPVEPGDTFVLCSDGLSNQVAAAELGAVVTAMPPDEAARFLIELANARGGPDNITCLIVQVPPPADGPSKASGKRPKGPGILPRVWNRVVRSAYPILGLGIVGAGASLWLGRTSEAVYLFLAAAGLLVAGIAGLIPQLLRQKATTAGSNPGETEQELRVYKAYPFELGPALFQKLADEEVPLREALKDKDGAFDYPSYLRLTEEAAAKLGRGEAAAAYRSRCLAFQLVAAAHNKDRTKEEAFQPNWTTPTRT